MNRAFSSRWAHVVGLAALGVLAVQASASAGTVTWTGLGRPDRSWKKNANWDTNQAPTSADDVVIDDRDNGSIRIDSDVDVKSITVTGACTQAVTSVNGTQIHVRGNFTVGSTATGGSITLTNTTMTVDGAFTLSNANMPFTQATGSLILDSTSAVTHTFNGSQLAAVTVGASGVTHTFADAFAAVGDLTIVAGSTLAGSSTLSVGGSWTNNGAFTGTGAVTLTATAIGKTIKSNGSRFSSLTFNGSAGGWTLSDRLWVPGGALTLTAGTLTASTFTARVGSVAQTAGVFTPSTGTLVVDGGSNTTFPLASVNGLRFEDTTESGLVGYWKLDAGAGTSVYDFSGTGNSGTTSASGTTWTSSVPATIGFDNANAMTFNGSSGVATVGTTSMPAANAAQSISAWINIAGLPASASSIVSLTGSSSAVKLGLSSGGLVQVLKNSGTLISTASAPSTGTWHHVAYTWDGTTNNLYIDGTAVTATATAHDSAAVTGAFIGATSASAGFFNGSIDDVRVYNAALTAAQVARLAAGRYAGTGGIATVTLGANLTVSGQLAVDDTILATSTRTLAASLATSPALVNTGTLTVGSAALSFSGGLTVQPGAALTLATSGGSVQIASAKTLTMNGTLNASSTGATIRSVSGNFAFQVGTASTSTPTLNITGLAVRNTDTNGMQINVNAGSVTTFTRFDNISFATGTGASLLQIYATSLYLASNGCTFDSGVSATTTNSVKLTGNGTADGDTRAVFGASTCASTFASCQVSKSDDDADNDGIGNTPASNGAVVQFVRAAETDTAGTIVGLPTAAFDWNTFTYYSTYVAYNNASGTSPVVYVRDNSGNPKYSWTGTAGETIVGAPRWNTPTGSSTHYLFVATSAGRVYRLVDNASSSLTLDGSWATNPFVCGCTIVTPLAMDTTNLYFGGTKTSDSTQRLWTVGQGNSQSQPTGSPFQVTPAITSAAPAVWINASTTYLIMGLTGHVIEVDVTGQVNSYDNSNPGSASIFGRIAIGTNGATRVFAGDSAGVMWALDPTPANFTGTQKVWSYSGPASQIGSPFYDYGTNTLVYGNAGGAVVSLSSAGAAQAGYPYTPGSASDAISTAPFYSGGVLLVGTQTGRLFVLDRNAGSGPALIRQYYFGPTQSVSGVGFDTSANRYMISTSDSSAKDGRLYYIDLVSDPTVGSS